MSALFAVFATGKKHNITLNVSAEIKAKLDVLGHVHTEDNGQYLPLRTRRQQPSFQFVSSSSRFVCE